jgi:CubicO group peptidase (beta-lactamase class C family)
MRLWRPSLLLVLILCAPGAMAQEALVPTQPVAVDGPATIDAPAAGPTGALLPAVDPQAEAIAREAAAREATAFEAYVDGLATATLAREDLAGLVVSVVRDDRVLLAKGYGMAGMAPPRAADGDTTMFRIGSVSKTFTYTAAMQLVAEGKLSLDDVVNDRLPPALALPDDGFAEPILVRHLLTHTAGYEDSALGHLFERDPAAVLSPEEYLVRHRPRRVRAPGTVAVYSNYSVAVLGAVIAHVSGLPFIDYVEQKLTGPLGMARATFREPLPDGDPRRIDPALAADLATGFQRRGGAFVPAGFEFIAHGAAAGGMSATAADMARWMRMHLNGGVLDGVRVLPQETSLAMRDVLFRNAPEAAGLAHGFLGGALGPYRTWGHGGATLYFHTAMVMVPARQVGVFASSNTDNARAPVAEFTRLVLERLLPDAAPAVAPIAVDAAALARYAGTYRSNRRAYSTIEKLFLGIGSDAVVSVGDDASLRITSGADTTRWLAIGPGLFQDAEAHATLQFLDDAAGNPDRYVAGVGVAVMERVALLDSAALLASLLGLAMLLSVGRIWRSFRREKRGQQTRPGLPAVKTLSIIAALAWLAFGVVSIAAVLAMSSSGNDALFDYPSTTLRVAVWLAWAVAILTALEMVAVIPVWRGSWRSWPKLRYTVVVAALACAVAVLLRWHVVPAGI